MDARPMVHFLKTGKGFKAATPKHTLTHIVHLKWDEHTLNTKGACIKIFKNTLYIPRVMNQKMGDRVVKAHLKRNFKHFLNTEKGRLMEDVNHILNCGYPEEDIDIKEMKPHYFSRRA